ncbi:MAG: aminotransferase class I/II-fold pyridoxal phosphate-dependent enzyme [Spirochaetales bacterium]|nr:aminotransferase class I/II-fold pyridoxal phosphate-dependent enzyme [Spirochaetales bacterium]
MNPLATELNEILKGSVVYEMLSDFGQRIYFPKGIISQSAEAKQRAHTYNATIGIATGKGKALFIPSIRANFAIDIDSEDLFPYSPTAGESALRKEWLSSMIGKNPTMRGKLTSLPVVTAGLTHSLSIVASLFIEKGQSIIVPDMYWGNYNLIFGEQRGAKLVNFPLFKGEGLNLEGLSDAIDNHQGNVIPLVLNFPNNPTGYTPTKGEAASLVELLITKAAAGRKLLVFTDDAYYGLFFEEDVCRESLFSLLCDAHPNILTVNGDAATKEEMVWGFRIGFMPFNSQWMGEEHYEALVKKVMGAIRGNISSCSKAAQSILLRSLKSESYQREKEEGIALIRERYRFLKECLTHYSDDSNLTPLPFNSGYFMAFECRGDAEALRVHLLENYGVGTISIGGKYLRLAFSSVDLEQIEDLLAIVYKGAREVFS